MFTYDEANITYAVTFGKGDGSSDIDYSMSFNKKEAKAYTKARMLGLDLDYDVEELDSAIYKCEKEIICYERYEYGTDISDARVSISFCDNQEQPPAEDIEAYLTDLLKAHKYELAHDVVEAQINVFDDTERDWREIALELAKELHCSGYIKKYRDEISQEKNKKPVSESISEKLKEALDNFDSYHKNISNVLKNYDSYSSYDLYSEGFFYIVTKMVDGKKRKGVLGHTGELLVPCKYAFLFETLSYKRRIGKIEHLISDYFAYQEEKDGPFGLIKVDGTIVLKPCFAYLGYTYLNYDSKHNMIAAGNNKKCQGVFSLELNKFVTPCKYESIGFFDEQILCSFNYRSVKSWRDTHDLDYYDYDAHLIKQVLDWRMYDD